MATVVSDRAASSINARAFEKGVWAEVSTYEAAALPANDVIQMIKVQAGSIALDGFLQIDAMSATSTEELGDGGDTDRYVPATTANTAGKYRFSGAAAFGNQYTVDDTIDVVNKVAAATGTIQAVVFFMNSDEGVDLT